jgi:ferredoxin-thioredoxin reductase catalytic subunit
VRYATDHKTILHNIEVDLINLPCYLVDRETDIDNKWACWKNLFFTVLNKHVPVRKRRVRNKTSVGWITRNINQKQNV